MSNPATIPGLSTQTPIAAAVVPTATAPVQAAGVQLTRAVASVIPVAVVIALSPFVGDGLLASGYHVLAYTSQGYLGS